MMSQVRMIRYRGQGLHRRNHVAEVMEIVWAQQGQSMSEVALHVVA